MTARKRKSEPDRRDDSDHGIPQVAGLSGNGKQAEKQADKKETGLESKIPVVAVVASAGGLEALQEFFSHLPGDSGAAFIVVTHQHSGRVSLLPELLAKTTTMMVMDAAEGVRLEPDHVYVSMPGGLLEIAGTVLHIDKGDPDVRQYRPIDHFLRFLAADQAEHAICIVLSGAGSDAMLGVREIKAAGGMIIVQEPSSAKYSSMPSSANATGLADYVLKPADMPAKLLDYIRGPFLQIDPPRGERERLPDKSILPLLLALRNATGHDFTGYKRNTISRRIERRMNVHGIDDSAGYLRYLQKNPGEARLLMQELLISVTSFFRDQEAFQVINEKILPALLAVCGDRPVRVWVPGCATGEEAYSVAILLHEQMTRAHRPVNVQIFGTDLDEHAIRAARTGVYPESIVADVSSQRLKHYFTHEENTYKVSREVREMIIFAVQNVLRDPPFTRLDLIVCRNFLIYLAPEAQKRILSLFHYSLRPGSTLFLGASESIGGLSDLFETIDQKWKIYARREVVPGGLPYIDSTFPGRPIQTGEPIERDAQPGHGTTAAHVQKLLLNRFSPPCVIIDGKGGVVYIQGRTGRFLEPTEGQPSHNILDMAREGLSAALSSALREVRTAARPVTRRGVRVRTNHVFEQVDVSVEPIDYPESLRDLLLVSFAVQQPELSDEKPTETADRPFPVCEEELEKELMYMRESLQTSIEELETSNEELRSSNEELQSTNEELQSTNEELETSKEEMQSLNEELSTVNTELQSKVDALSRMGDDMKNLLNSTQVACVFLDEQFKVRGYTEKARDLIRLVDSDIGRPLADLATNLAYDGLVEDCREVLENLLPRETEICDRQGRWYLLRILPYRTAGNIIDGVVITLVNIDRTKTAEQNKETAQTARDIFHGIVKTVHQPLVVLDSDLCVISANEAFYRMMRARASEVDGRSFFKLGDRQWDIPRLRELLETELPEHGALHDFEVEHEFPMIGYKKFLLNGRRLEQPAGKPALILLAMKDISERLS
jgi:two-component system, chemotaxis family, CheB/CheR fusion protein